MEKRFTAIICCIIAVACSVVTWFVTTQVIANTEKTTELRLSEEKYDTLSQFLDLADLQDLIENYYYLDIDKQSLTDGALKGMVNALEDPYSTYYTKDEYKDYMQANDGLYVGVGLSMLKEANSNYFFVVSVTEGSPAAQAGIEPGDEIATINGKSVYNMTLEEASDIVAGPVGSTLTLGILQEDGSIEEKELVRAEIQKDFVTYNMYGDICNIIIDSFHGDVSEKFAEALEYAEKQNAKGIVLDLRGNLGGSVSECVSIADQILPEGVVVYTIDKNGDRQDYTSSGDYNDIPMAVLVNSASASASEILAGAIQDYGRGPIIGTQTYGKGVVQSVFDMPYSGGGVKLTSSVYYTPNGRCINGEGITPDEVVNLPDEVLSGDVTFSYDNDTQLQAAINYLNENAVADTDAETES